MSNQLVDFKNDFKNASLKGKLRKKNNNLIDCFMFSGYMKPSENGPVWDTEKNSECFVGDVYLTGDKCYMDDEGYIYFVGRADDIINSSGYIARLINDNSKKIIPSII